MPSYPNHIALLGSGTIGLSMIALHLRRRDTKVTLYDPRPDMETHLRHNLPKYLDPSLTQTSKHITKEKLIDHLIAIERLSFASSIEDAVLPATIIQEQTPERVESKQALWDEVSRYANDQAHLWSSSSGIPASVQARTCPRWVRKNLVVVHPFNPPHLMPLVEIVPGPESCAERVEFVSGYFETIPGPESLRSTSSSDVDNGSHNESGGQFYRPVVLKKEIPGFVGNRLAFALLKEACFLVGEGVVSAADLDAIVTASLGPRWAGSGVFESYHAGGGDGGIGAFLEKLAPTIQDVWGSLGDVQIRTDKGEDGSGGDEKEKWREMVVRQTEEAYGSSTSAATKAKKKVMLRGVIEMQRQCWE